jgi:hypothetical protein
MWLQEMQDRSRLKERTCPSEPLLLTNMRSESEAGVVKQTGLRCEKMFDTA